MPTDIMNNWLNSRKYAQIDSMLLMPQVHPNIKTIPLSVQRGQAEVYYLKANDGSPWILKKFYTNKCPDSFYLNKICSILPNHKAFLCGKERKILTSQSLNKNYNTYYLKELGLWLTDTVLMPQISGQDWTSFTDMIRNKEMVLTPQEQIMLCKNLATIIKVLEKNSISHRDLSGGNIFIDTESDEILLIDFDSLYHPNLPMPVSTTIGSEGYTAPFIIPDNTKSSYCHFADRFALTVLCVEFLILNHNSPFCHEGGIFNQKEIYRRNGKTINYAKQRLKKYYPKALQIFEKAISSNSFKNCPLPDEWLEFCDCSVCLLTVNDLPEVNLKLPYIMPEDRVVLPDNPWKY